MSFLYDKIFLLIFSMLPLFSHKIEGIQICVLLAAVASACLCQVINKRAVKVCLESGYFILCLFIPEFTLMAAVVLYDAVRTRDYFAVGFCGAALIKGFFTSSIGGWDTAFVLLLCILSFYCCRKTLRNKTLSEENKRSRDNSTELERLMLKRNRELSENLEYEIRLTTLNERNRIAREIHDNVGHLLSRSLLQTGALCAVCPKDQEAIAAGLDNLKGTLNSAMNSIRESVHGIRDDSLDLKLEAAKILSGLKEKIQVQTDYDISEEVPPKIKLCFIAILKEAVSNISRHSTGSKAVIILREHPSMYQLIVSDNGNGKIDENGMGISNMRERAEGAGGNFSISDTNGVCVFVSVRKEERQDDKNSNNR